MSAGLGDVIEEFLRQALPFPLQESTHVVSNRPVGFGCSSVELQSSSVASKIV